MFLRITDTHGHPWLINRDHVVAVETILGPLTEDEERDTRILLSTGDTIKVKATIEKLSYRLIDA